MKNSLRKKNNKGKSEGTATEPLPGVTNRTLKWDDTLAENIREAYRE